MNGLVNIKSENDFEFDWCKNKKGEKSTNSPRKIVEER